MIALSDGLPPRRKRLANTAATTDNPAASAMAKSCQDIVLLPPRPRSATGWGGLSGTRAAAAKFPGAPMRPLVL